jgi:histidinol-phosphate aminotransferase
MEANFTPKVRSFLQEYRKPSYIKEEPEPIDVVVDCALGVNPFGCSPTLSDFMKSGKEALSPYPAYPYLSLRQAISRYWADTATVEARDIRVSGGSMAILDMLCKCFIDPGGKVLGFVPQFTDFSACVMSFGGVYEAFPLNANHGYALDVEAFCGAVSDGHRLVYMDNPNNPTGQAFPLDAISRVAERCRERGAVLIVDEAYGDFLDNSASALTLFPEYDNLCVVRTFSKGFGLAGMRVGYAFMHEPLAGCYDRVGYPFTVSAHGAALAEMALLDGSFINSSREAVAKIKGEVLSSLTRLRVARTHPDVPICTLLADTDASLHGALLKHGVLSEAGEDFANLGPHAVRLRVPVEAEPLISILREVERMM